MLTRRTTACSLVLAIFACQYLWAAGDSWNRLRYNGGTVPAKVNPFDWNTSLKVGRDDIAIVIAYRQTVHIKPAEVTALSYGREAHRRVADMVALSFVATPLALFGLLHKSKVHFIGIEYRSENGKPGAVLMEAHKDDYRAILNTLESVTGKHVENEP
jgi:hypothetical protein